MLEIVTVQGLPLVACLVMLAILCYIGVHVLKREIIFIDIALAQIAAVGAIVAHVVFHLHGHSIFAQGMALGATIVAAAFFAVVRRKVVQIPLEAVIGVCYAVSAAAALFLVGVAPGGHVHIQEMLAGSILWATWSEVVWSAGVFAGVGICFYIFREPFRVISESYDDALAKGYNTLGWDFLFYALVGVVITVTVRIAGVVVVFTFLIVPATLSAVFAHGWSARVAVAWMAGAVSTALGLLFATRYDFSVGPSISLFLIAGLVVIGLLRAVRVRKGTAGVVWLCMSVVLGLVFVSGADDVMSDSTGRFGEAPDVGSITHTHDPGGQRETASGSESVEIAPDSLARITNVDLLAALYANEADVEQRSLIAGRALELDVPSGARMAIEFLSEDPPLLFRMTIIDKLSEVLGKEMRYDIDLPFTSQTNQKAISELKAATGLKQQR